MVLTVFFRIQAIELHSPLKRRVTDAIPPESSAVMSANAVVSTVNGLEILYGLTSTPGSGSMVAADHISSGS